MKQFGDRIQLKNKLKYVTNFSWKPTMGIFRFPYL